MQYGACVGVCGPVTGHRQPAETAVGSGGLAMPKRRGCRAASGSTPDHFQSLPPVGRSPGAPTARRFSRPLGVNESAEERSGCTSEATDGRGESQRCVELSPASVRMGREHREGAGDCSRRHLGREGGDTSGLKTTQVGGPDPACWTTGRGRHRLLKPPVPWVRPFEPRPVGG